MKSGKLLSVLYVAIFLFVLAGSTFAYFTLDNQSSEGAIGGKSATVGINLLITPKYVEKELVPMNDADVFTAYKNRCVDINSYGACQAYVIDIENVGETLDYEGTVNFSITDIANLNYLVLDGSILDVTDAEMADTNFDFNDYVYKGITNITADTDQSLGEAFNLPKEGTKSFVMIVWVPNFERDQFDDDGAGTFGATVTYKSTGNYKISGSITGN